MGRILALDYGIKRTGIAVTDPLQIIASGLNTVETHNLLAFLVRYVKEEKVKTIVVGEPRQMDGSPSESEAFIQVFLKGLKVALPTVNIVRQDERFTSKMANRTLIEGGTKKKKRMNKALVDEISATLILQAYLNRIQ
ncbi:Holliday junction resolvase RuvX [Eudoraea chungangensis]|uniref:Holliday junction resolvase RuvX n=1 Tax=Eudoraea chungangensis TaxID=1481905 RepID=UPI0023EB36E3|nr:Holliday junction resolvase RuvX [Eudoraea chungangensis]